MTSSKGKSNEAFIDEDERNHHNRLESQPVTDNKDLELQIIDPIYENGDDSPALPAKKGKSQSSELPLTNLPKKPKLRALELLSNNRDNRPLSMHNYEELPFTADKSAADKSARVRLTSISESTDNFYVPNPPPLSSLPSVATSRSTLYSNYDSRIGSEYGSDVTILRDGPRKRENPLYDTSRKSGQSEFDNKEKKDSYNCVNNCKDRTLRMIWIAVIILFLLMLLLLVLIVLLIIGAVKTTSSFDASAVTEKTKEAYLKSLKTEKEINLLQDKVAYLSFRFQKLDLGSNSTIQEVVANNTAVLHGIDQTLKDYMMTTNEAFVNVSKALQKVTKDNSDTLSTLLLLSRGQSSAEKELTTLKKETANLKQTTQNTQAELNILKFDLGGLLKCDYNTTGRTSYSQPASLVTEKFPLSADFFKNRVLIAAQCSAENGIANTPTESTIPNTSFSQYSCLCTASSKAVRRFVCRIHVFSCEVS